MQVHCRLREIMDERRIKVEALHRMSGVGREAISTLRGSGWQRVSRVAIGKLCGTLNVTPNDLFILYPDDIWAPIKLGGKLTIHYGSRFDEAPHSGDGAGEMVLAGQFVGVWDMRTCELINEYLKQSGFDVSVTLKEHVTGRERGYDPMVREAVHQIFDHGNHLLIGSPVANQSAEEVVCHAFGVPPYTPGKRGTFPYGFVWDARRPGPSSFGWEAIGKEVGIASTQTGKLVAQRTMVKAGEGRDCALILVYRIFVPPARREREGGRERVVICILGHSGAGTLAGAKVAIDPRYAAGLYPRQCGVPHMRVVSATYTRAPIASMHDNREVMDAFLVDEPTPETDPPHPANGGKPRRKRKRANGAAHGRERENVGRPERGETESRPMLGAPRGR